MAWACFERFSIEITRKDAMAMAHQGDCDEDVKAHVTLPRFKRQLDKIPVTEIAAELKEYGAWDAEELSNEEENRMRVLWLAACDVKENYQMRSVKKQKDQA